MQEPQHDRGLMAVASGARSPLENAATLFTSRLLAAAASWAGSIFIIRSLDSTEWGQFSFVFSLLAMVAVITDLGVGRVALAAVLDAKDGARAAGNYLMLRSGLGVLGYGLVMAIVLLGGYDADVIRATALGGTVLLIATIINGWTIAFQAAERMGHVAFSNVVVQLGQLALVIALSMRGGNLLWFVFAAVARDLLLLPWRVIRARQLLTVTFEFHWPIWRAMLREALPLSIGIVLQNAYWRIDSVMLSKLTTFEDVGIYGIAFKFADLAHAAPSAMSIAILTPLVRAWPDKPVAFRRAFSRSAAVLLALAGFAIVQMLLYARPLIGVLYPGYEVATASAQLLVIAEAGGFLALLAITALVAAGRHVIYPIITFMGLVVNVALNFWLIPEYSYLGASITTLVTEVVVAIALLTAVAQLPPFDSLDTFRLGRAAAVAGTAAVAGLLSGWIGLPWPVGIAVVTVTYLGAAIAAGYPALLRDFIRADEPEDLPTAEPIPTAP